MNQLCQWQAESGHTMREMGRQLQVSSSHICRVMQGKKSLSKAKLERLNEIMRMERLIRSAPPDRFIIQYELNRFIGKENLWD